MSQPSRTNPQGGKPEKPPATATGWTALTWDHLERWAGSRSVSRGRAYQRGRRVRDLRITEDGRLLATVMGSDRYATTVSVLPGKSEPTLASACTCPIGGSCKHAVAVVAEYLDALANARDVPLAADDDPRWADLERAASGTPRAGDEEDAYEGDEDYDDDADVIPTRKSNAPKSRSTQPAAPANWNAKIEQHIRAKTQGELADLAWSLVRRFPEVYQEFRERISLQEGKVEQLVAETRRDIARITREPAWRNHWNGEGHLPDYSRIRHRFERLLELGHADEVVSLGRDFLREGLRQVSESHDEGETATEFSHSLEVVFLAVARSSLSGPERLLFAIDAVLEDDYDTVGQATDTVFEADTEPANWSVVADTLIARLKAIPSVGDRDADRFSRNYQRDRITGWVARALNASGRESELLSLYESETRITGSYERFVRFLLERGRVEDAERWAREGITATANEYPGIASHLAERLCELAAQRKQWDVVAAHAAYQFFDRPSPPAFHKLIEAAGRARVKEKLRAEALRFLETGTAPVRVVSPAPTARADARPRPTGRRKAAAIPPAPALAPTASPALEIDPAWPLPVPDYLIPLMSNRRGLNAGSRPHLDVLLQMAIDAKRPDEVLAWFDKMQAESERLGRPTASAYAERVAQAVSQAYPERAIETYQAALDAQLPHASSTAYETATRYLRTLRPLYEALNRTADWSTLLSTIREKYKNRPRFMELLDTLEGRTIVQSARKRK